MIRIAALLVLLSSASTAATVDSLSLHLDAVVVRGVARIVASASNCSADTVKFCGRWSSIVGFVPTAEYAARMEEESNGERRRQEEAAAAGRQYYSRGNERCIPPVFDIGNLVAGAERWVTIAPSESFSDTLVFGVGTDSVGAGTLDERNLTGWMEVRYRLDLCDEAASRDSVTAIPENGAGGELVAQFPQR